MREPTSTNQQAQGRGPSRAVYYWIVAVLVAFIGGYLIPWIGGLDDKARLTLLSAEASETRDKVVADSVAAHGADAALYVAIGDYVGARANAKQFFDGLAAIQDTANVGLDTSLDSLKTRRDDVMGLLADRNELALYQLLDLYSRVTHVVGGRERIFTDPKFR